MLITLIGTGDDLARYGAELRNILASIPADQPTELVVSEPVAQTVLQPVQPSPSGVTIGQPVVQPQPANHAGQGADISWAREAKIRYGAYRKAAGLPSDAPLSQAVKDQLKAGADPVQLANAGQVQLPVQLQPQPQPAQPVDEIAQLKAQLDAAMARLQAPQPQPSPTAAAIGQVQRYGQLPASGAQLPMNVRQVLANWATGLTGSPTEGRMHAVAQYAAGGPLQPVVDAYGAHIDKVLKKVNGALAS